LREDDDFTPPIVSGLQRDPRPAEQQRRSRILTDAEVRALWTATDERTPYNGLVRMLLLTAQRWAKVAGIQLGEISTDGVWTLPRAAREKGDIGSVRLPGLPRNLLAETPQIEGRPFVFPGAAGVASATIRWRRQGSTHAGARRCLTCSHGFTMTCGAVHGA